jgi:hypothetical protein
MVKQYEEEGWPMAKTLSGGKQTIAILPSHHRGAYGGNGPVGADSIADGRPPRTRQFLQNLEEIVPVAIDLLIGDGRTRSPRQLDPLRAIPSSPT